MIARRAVVVAAISGLSLLTLGAAAPAPEQTAPAAATALAHRVATGTLDDATAAMSEVYAWAGVGTVDAQGKTVAKGVAPTIPITKRSFEMQKAAIAARAEPTTDLADLAKLLEDLGGFAPPEVSTDGFEAAGQEFAKMIESGKEITPEDMARMSAAGEKFGGDLAQQMEGAQSALDGELAGIVFADILGEMIRASRAEPKNPHNFVPLFLEAMAKERDERNAGGRPLDLAAGEAHPDEIVLTLTEADLFLLMFMRHATSYAAMPVRYASLDMPILAAPGTRCSDLVDKLGDYAKTAVPHAADAAGGAATSAFYKWFEERTGRAISEPFQLVIGYAAKAIRLMTWLMDTSEFEVTPTPTDAHYAHTVNKEVEVTFKAEVKLPSGGPSDSAEAAGCLNTLFGFNIPDSPEALAKSMKDWRVYWEFKGLEGHATPSTNNKYQYHTQLGNGLTVSGTKGTSETVVDLAHEEDKADARGEQKKGTMRVEASLDQSASFDPSLLFKGGKAGAAAGAAQAAGYAGKGAFIIVDALIDVLIEWAKKVLPRKANATVKVTWHEPKVFGWEGTIKQEVTLAGGRDYAQVVSGRAPPAIAIGVSIAPPADGKEVFHDEGTATRTMSVKVNGGREGQRIHEYRYVSADHAKSTSNQKTPEVCMRDGGATWAIGTWTTDSLETVDISLKGTGFTKVDVTFEERAGTYLIDTSIPYASGDFNSSDKYEGNSSCTGEDDPANRPFRKFKKPWKVGPFRLFATGKAKPDAKVLSGSVIEPIKPDGALGTKGTIKTTWNLKRIEVKEPPAPH